MIKENILFLENRFQDSKLEYDYLSSSEKLLEYQRLYFEKSLEKKILKDLKKIDFSNEKLIITDLTIGKNGE